MKTKGINWATIAVKDMDEAVGLFSKLLGTTFARSTNSKVGAAVAISEETRLELVSPLPGYDNPVVRRMTEVIDRSGGGLFALMFSVDDADQAAANAEELGLSVNWLGTDWEEQAELFPGKTFKLHKEFVLGPADACGALVGFCQKELG